PGGFVSIDKPPLGFWLQAASAKIFGFTPLSIFLPQALAGVFSVLLLYYLVRHHFGVVAGLLAALALAISPISVLTNRNNTIDSTLMLVMLLGAWAVLRAAQTGKLRWLLTMAVFFSVATFFHQYYLSTFAPAICALFGIGVVVMWQDYRTLDKSGSYGWRGWLLPLALLLTALEQIHIIISNPSWGMWLIPLIALPCPSV